MRTLPLFVTLFLLTLPGCGGSSHRISTINGKTSAKFNNKPVEDVCKLLTEKFAPLKGYTAEIPPELKGTRLTFEFSDVSTIKPVSQALGEATGYNIEIDEGAKKIRFKKRE